MGFRRLALAALVVVALAAPGEAVPRPQIVDPRGDALFPDPGVDILSATFSTTGTRTTRKVRGRRVTTYLPTHLVVTVELAGPPSRQQGTSLHVRSTVAGCGLVDIVHSPGALLGDYDNAYVSCAGDEADLSDPDAIVPLDPTITGDAITWSIALRTLRAAKGTEIDDIVVYTDAVEPVLGSFDTASFVSAAAFDEATGGPYVVG